MNLDKLSKAELLQLRKDVAKAIADFDANKRAEALAAAEAAAREAGFSLKELVGAKGTAKPRRPAKYQHPENPELTWSGRGRQPQWFKEQVQAGMKPEALEIS